MPNRHIVPDGKKWSVKEPGVEKPISTHRKQSTAEDAATRDIKREGGGERITHGRDGQIRSKDTIAPGRESKTKDKEH